MQRLFAAICGVAVLGGGISACGSDSGSGSGSDGTSKGGPITIGVAAALSGANAGVDGPAINGLKLWAAKANADGGLQGRKVKLITADTQTDINRGAPAAQSVLAKGADMLVVPCDYDYGGPGARVANAQKKVALSLCAGSPLFGVQGVGPYAFTMGTATPTVGSVLAEFAKKQGYKRPYLLTDTTIQYTKSITKTFTQRWKELGGTLGGQNSFQGSDSSIASQINAIQRSGADSVVASVWLVGGPSALKQIRDAGVKLPILTTDGMDGAFWLKAAPHLTDVYYPAVASVFGNDPSKRVNQFVADYRTRFNEAPPSGLALLGYSLGEAIGIAVQKSGGKTDGDAMKGALEQFKAAPLLHGPQTFTAKDHIDPMRALRILELVNGKHKYVTTITPQRVDLSKG
jgi:branched-chain amino acid transport system substrate-binding protein